MALAVKDVMVAKVHTAEKNLTLLEAVKRMKKLSIGSLVVVQENEAVGIITRTDIVNKAVVTEKNLKKTTIAEIMSSPLITIKPEASLREAAETMAEYKIKKLVVINSEGALVGIVTATDLIMYGPEFVNVLVNLTLPKPEKTMGG